MQPLDVTLVDHDREYRIAIDVNHEMFTTHLAVDLPAGRVRLRYDSEGQILTYATEDCLIIRDVEDVEELLTYILMVM